MKRTVFAAALVLLVGAAAGIAYNAAARDREYRRLVSEGESAVATRQAGLAIEAFSGAIALKPDSMLAYLKRGETYRRQGELQAALRDLRAANTLDPTATRPLEQLGDLYVSLQRYDRAAERYAAYIQIDDRSSQVLYKLGLARYDGGDARAALQPLRQAIALNDRFAEAHYLLGLCLEANRRPREALAALERAVSLAPALLQARDALAAAYRAAGRREDAIGQLETLAALERDRPVRALALGLAYADVGRTDLAVATLSRATERFPDSVGVYTALGEVWLRVAESRLDRAALGRAREALSAALVRGASTSRDLALYGRAQLLDGDSAGALQSLTDAASRLPVAPDTYRHLATAAARQGQRRQARDALVTYTLLLAGAPVPRDVMREIGSWSLDLHEPDKAVVWLARAMDPAAPDPVLFAELAEAELDAGRPAAARTTIERGLQHAPADPALLRLRSRVDRGAS